MFVPGTVGAGEQALTGAGEMASSGFKGGSEMPIQVEMSVT